MPHYDFIEIGTSDFATCIQRATNSQSGISVECVKTYLDRLPNRPLVKKVHAAISDTSGTISVYYIPDSVRMLNGLPSWMKGTNSIDAPHPTVTRYLSRRGLPLSLIHHETVPVMTLPALFQEHAVESVDYLKIDTEGHDCVILNSLMDTWDDGGIRPRHIRFESNSLCNIQSIEATRNRLTAYGYSIRVTKTDTDATLP